jgi:hypothetical protein
MKIAEILRGLEEKLFSNAVRKDSDTLSTMLAEEFREFGSSGRAYSRPEIIASLQSGPPVNISMEDFAVEMLTEGIALATYKSVRDVPGSPAIESLRSSIWILRDNRWQMRFHQGTRMPVPATSAADN